jgi:hypothetical protein
VVCPKCASENPEENSFCGRCGTQLPRQTSARCLVCGEANVATNAFCVRCGRPLSSGVPHPAVDEPEQDAQQSPPASSTEPPTTRQSSPQRLSTGIYVSLPAVITGVAVIGGVVAYQLLVSTLAAFDADADAYRLAAVKLKLLSQAIGPLYWTCLLVGLLPGVLLLYKAWQSIQDGHARMTPGKAVGYSLIPVFNLYWMFQTTWGFAKDYNAYAARYALPVRRLSELLFLLLPIVLLGGILLYVGAGPLGYWYAIPACTLGLVVAAKVCDAVNAIPDAAPPADRTQD